MRFTRRRTSRVPRPITKRRLSYSERALQRERDKFPLLRDWIAEQQPTALERLERFQYFQQWKIDYQRQCDARTWRRARAMLRSLPPEIQSKILHEWNNHCMPGTSGYFADLVYRRGRQYCPGVFPEPRKYLEQILTDQNT